MAKHLTLSMDDTDRLYYVAKALASRPRLEILKLLYYSSLNINEIAEKLHLPASSTAMHIRALEQAGLINTEAQPGTRGVMKLCNRKKDSISISFNVSPEGVREVESYSMPVGNFTDCRVAPTCGLASATEHIVNEDIPSNFYTPQRTQAKLVWTSAGYFEYRFPSPAHAMGRPVRKLSLCAEVCSEAPNYREDWPSDITLTINGVDCGTWQSPGDFGSRRGRLTPPFWTNGATQYGMLTTWSIDEEGNYINFVREGKVSIDQLRLEEAPYIVVRLGNKEGAENVGGINIFGDCFGDYEQDIVLTVEY